MSLTQTLTYNSGASFVYDSTKVDFGSGLAKLLISPQPGQLFASSFASSAGFTFDNTKTEFVASVLRQKNIVPANGIFFAPLSVDAVAAGWSGGSTAGTLAGSTAFSGGKLNLTGGNAAWAGAGNSPSGLTGCFRAKITPGYSGTPGDYQLFMSACPNAGVANLIEIYHAITTGQLVISFGTSAGGSLFTQNLGVWNPTAGTEYELELNFDIGTGATRVFVDGVQMGSTNATTGTRVGAANLYVGRDTATYASNFKVRNLQVFSAAQHTANYTPSATTPSFTAYQGDAISFPVSTYAQALHLVAFTAASVTDSNAPHYTLNGLYWNGAAWVTSNASYAQASTAAQITANIGVLPASDTLAVVMYTQDGNASQMSVSAFSITYTGQLYPTSNPSILVSTGTVTNMLDSFSSVFSASGSDSVGFIINVGGSDRYWNGSAWVASNGTLAQTSTSADLTANVATLDLTDGTIVKIKVLLHSSAGLTSPSITSATYTYEFSAIDPTSPAQCEVYAFLKDILDLPPTVAMSAVLIIENTQAFFYQDDLIGPFKKTFSFDSLGFVSAQLVETVTPGNKKYSFSIQFTDVDGKKKTVSFNDAVVPMQASAALNTITDVAS